MAIYGIRYRAVLYRKDVGAANFQPADQLYSSAPDGAKACEEWIRNKMKMKPGEFTHGIIFELSERVVFETPVMTNG